MTRDEFKTLIEVRRDFDFSYRGRCFVINAVKKADGEYQISFGPQYESPARYESFRDLMANAQIGNRILPEILRDIDL